MPGTVIANLTDISLCESPFAGWTNVGIGTQGLNDPTIFDSIQGSYCYQDYKTSIGNRGAQWDFGSGQDLQNKIIIFWFAFSKVPHATNPMRIRVTDTNGNWGEWNIFTKDTLPHLSWISWAVNTSVTFDITGGTAPTMSSIRYIDWRMDSVVAKVYIYWDAVRYGTGLAIKGGTSEDSATLDDLVAADKSNAYGIIEKSSGVYMLQGNLTIGSLTPDESTYFKILSQVVQFKSLLKEPSGFYEIKGQNATSGSGTTKIFLGAKSGTAGISGCFIRAPSTMKFKLTMNDAYLTELGLYGSTFVNADTINLPVNNTNKEVIDCNFEACAKLIVNLCTVKGCKFISAPGDAVLISNDPHYVTDCDFINCLRGVELDTVGDGEYDFNALKFTGTTYHVNNTSGSTLTVANGNGSNASTYTGSTVNFTGSVTLTITVKNEAGEPIVGALAYIDDNDQTPYIMNTTTNDEGVATTGYTGAPVTNARWRVRKYGYKQFKQLVSISSEDINLPVTLVVDPQQT